MTDEVVEYLASAILDFVSKNKGIVVVTRIDKKPKRWIESPYISKMSLQRVRKSTIGITSSLSRKEAEELENLKNAIQTEKKKSNLKTYLLAGNILVFSLYTIIVSNKSQPLKHAPTPAIVETKAPPTKSPEKFLDKFPYYIKTSIVEATKNPELVLKKIALGEQKEEVVDSPQESITSLSYPDEIEPQELSPEENELKLQQIKEKLEQKQEIIRLQKIRSDFLNNIQDTYDAEEQSYKFNAFFNQLEMELGGIDLNNSSEELSEADMKKKFKHLKVSRIKEKFQETLAKESDPEKRKLIANRLVNAISVATDF